MTLRKWLRALWSWDSRAALAAFCLGVILYHVGAKPIQAEAEPIFLASSAIGLSTLAASFAGVALFVAVLENVRYRTMLNYVPGSLRGAVLPYRVMGFVALAATLAGLAAAVLWAALPPATWWLSVVFALPPALGIWCIVGTWQLFEITALHVQAGQIYQPPEQPREGQPNNPTISSTVQR